jgi:hypothetical protein
MSELARELAEFPFARLRVVTLDLLEPDGSNEFLEVT